mgnify:CR=1 FL=1
MIQTQELTVTYVGDQLALDKVSVTIEKGKIVGILGPNGAGKSTFIKAILGLIPLDGQVALAGKSPQEMLHQLSYVEQRSQIDRHFPMTVRECVSLGAYQAGLLFLRLQKSDWERVDAALAAVGLSDYKDRTIKHLSGGQFQRMLLARCLVQDGQMIFLDEPFVGIDQVSEAIILDILKDLRNQGRTILVVHHDLNKVKAYFDTVLLLNRRLIAYGPVDQVFTAANLKEAFGELILIGGGTRRC